MEPLVDWLRGWALRLRHLTRRAEAEREIEEELRFHVEMEARRLVERGVDPNEARRLAAVHFGGEERFREQARDARGTRFVEDGVHDLKYGLRMIFKNPVFSAVAIVTLALGIGATTAIYTVVEAVLLEPLPFRESGELALLHTRNDEQNQEKYLVSPLDFDDWRRENTAFEAMAAYWPTTATVTENDGNPTRVSVVFTTEDYFEVLGASTVLGRTFSPDEGPGSSEVVVLGHGFWQRRFGGDASIVGSTVTIDGDPKEVIGVLRPEHTFPQNADLWINMTWPMTIQSRAARWMSALGRLDDGATVASAQADMERVAGAIEQANPESNRGWTVTVASLRDELVGDTRTALLVLLSATGLVLLIACANVANLLLSRSEVRAREIAVRVAFGAGRGRLIRQLLTESLLLSGAGAVLGLGLGALGVRGLLAVAPVTLPRENAIGLDGTVLAVVLGVSVVTGALFGLAPIVRLVFSNVHSSIRDGARSTGSAAGARLQSGFVVAQLAMAVMLVAGAGLLVKSFQNLRTVDTGFQTSGVLTAELDLPQSVAPNDTAVIDFYAQFRDRIAALPGVEVVGDAASLPLGENLDYFQPFSIADRSFPAELEPRAFLRPVAPGFFEALRTPVLEGRSLEPGDRLDATGVVVVNQSFAERFFAGESPLGEVFDMGGFRFGPLGALNKQEWEIVGVVQDVKYDGLRADAQPAIYFSGLQSSLRRRTLVIRTSGAPAALAAPLRAELATLASTVALTNVRTMDDVLASASSRDRFSTLLLTIFGVVALTLASVGVYGVLAYAVEQRKGEVGIRMALGADRGAVRGMVLKDGARLVGVGLAVGIVAAVLLSGLIASQLYGVSPRDPAVLATVTLVLLSVGLAASWIPAWRATRVNPVVAMRGE